jgi:hypothetical protein
LPGINELEQLSKSYGLAIGLLIVGCAALGIAVTRLYRENQQVYARMEKLLEERLKTLESFLSGALDVRRHS